MQQIFPTYPRAVMAEALTALELRARLGKDANGRALQTELNDVLERSCCGEAEADLWRELVAAADDETAAYHAELDRERRERQR
jgi:hypothetical protein